MKIYADFIYKHSQCFTRWILLHWWMNINEAFIKSRKIIKTNARFDIMVVLL